MRGIVTAYSPGILSRERLHLPDAVVEDPKRILTQSDGLFKLDQRYAIGRIHKGEELEKGIMIGGAGAFNWYHFMIECLPKVFLVRRLPAEYDDYPLLVPEECREVQSFAAALAFFSGNRPVRFMRRREYISVNHLVVFDDISVGPFNLYPGHWPRIDDYQQHDGLLREFFAEVRANFLGSDAHHVDGRRIFLTRPIGRRKYNQDELIDISRIYGFEQVSLESLSLKEQAKVFSEASVVVGASGAAWVGMIFRERPLFGLSWLPSVYAQFCSYSTLAHMLGHRIDFIEAKTTRDLTTTGEVYSADYWVNPFDFETALRKIIGG